MGRYWTTLLTVLFCLFCTMNVKGAATYPSAISTLVQAAFDPVYWLTTFHHMDLSRQVRSRWLRLLPDFLTGQLRLRPAHWRIHSESPISFHG
ncbi:hypothetical protein HNY73_017509 [Argiope bruennichi]|uniref:Uncharacterized protein n=1 Tax=Argiope bruennichi TaxID=94029 RepID=A0A8T0EAX7_ARGBR|nr:hypothetical protein HNY73_017509 [Argiope bruennichi]